MQEITRHIRGSFKKELKTIKNRIQSFSYRGNNRLCPICQKQFDRFLPAGLDKRNDALCPFCHSLERHRLAWMFFSKRTNLFDGQPKTMLHVAPEPCFEKRLRKCLGDQYVTADYIDPRVMVKMDIADIQYPDAFFDVIYCSHVLEHVIEDRKAMCEFQRVLKPTGWAVLLVPITVEKTFEDEAITSPEDRLRLFGQSDHVRRYGHDYIDRLIESGFKVVKNHATDFITSEYAELTGVLSVGAGDIFYCTK